MHEFEQLEYVGLRNCPISGISSLSELHALTHLDLAGTRVTDTGLEHLSGLSELARLDLGGTQLTDAGLEHLTELHGLETLNLGRTQVTDVGGTMLKQALPTCLITVPSPTRR